MNLEKTSITPLGHLHLDDLTAKIGITIKSLPIETLGININSNTNDYYALNFKKRLDNMKTTLEMWSKRHLSLKGKIEIVNTLALSPLLYLCSIISVPKIVIKEAKDIILKFIWDS